MDDTPHHCVSKISWILHFIKVQDLDTNFSFTHDFVGYALNYSITIISSNI